MNRMDMNKWRKLGLDGTERNSEKIEKLALKILELEERIEELGERLENLRWKIFG